MTVDGDGGGGGGGFRFVSMEKEKIPFSGIAETVVVVAERGKGGKIVAVFVRNMFEIGKFGFSQLLMNPPSD